MKLRIVGFVFSLCFIDWIKATDLTGVIQELQLGVRARIKLFYGEPNPAVLATDEISKLLLNDKADYELRKNFQASALAIINCENEQKNSSGSGLLLALRKTLNARRQTDLLFVTKNSKVEEWFWLFDWCWNNGFYNVLLVNDGTEQLYTFDPFPVITIQSKTLKNYLNQRNNWRNLKGYKIRVAAGNNPPRALVYRDKNGKIRFSGLIPLLLKTFSQHYNATLEVVLMPNFENYTVYDCVTALIKKTVNVCADALIMGGNFTIDPPLFLGLSNLIVPFAQSIPRFRYFLTPFSWNVWITICLIIVYIIVILAITEHQNMGAWNFGYYFLQVLSSVLHIAFDLGHLQGRSKFLIRALLVIFGFIISNFYLAMLSTILTTNIYEQQIESLADIRERNLTILISDFDREIFTAFGGHEILAANLLDVSRSEQDKYFYDLNPKYVYPKLMDKCDFYLYQQKFMARPRMKAMESYRLSILGGMPTMDNWPLMNIFHKYEQHAFDAGLYEYFKGYTQEEAIRAGQLKFFKTEQYTVAALSMEYFEMPAILLGCGYLCALISFFLEQFKRFKEN